MKKEINKNMPIRLTLTRMILSLIIVILLLFPFDMINFSFSKYLINDTVIIDVKLIICAVLFVIAAVTDFLDGRLARKYNLVSDTGKVMDSIADKILIDAILVVLCGQGYISPIIPVVIIIRDIFIDAVKMLASKNGEVVGSIVSGKFKTFFLMVGITLKLIGNYPLGLWNVSLDDFFIITGTLLAILSAVEYYRIYKKFIDLK
ncbi:MAG: CDP-diacylglycerol--glycerol-3-phosphate 3-phosphatidyltransferase [Bacilli bacterium]|nr:CDP-diacylglycerol--glycerol-3-phosphate 3-phosphatidyltransferase [Bacilli bacterium]